MSTRAALVRGSVALAAAAATLGATRALPTSAAGGPASLAQHQAQCAGKEGWSDPAPPIRIFANVYDVGSCGIVVLLVTGAQGHVLIDAAPADAAPFIIANIRRLGFRPRDVKLMLSTHEHVDHAGGFAALRRETGARLLASPPARAALERGGSGPDDPQFNSLDGFEPVRVDGALEDKQVVEVGALRLTVRLTPGHAPGGATWTWRSCDQRTCRSVVYADSFSPISAKTYRFTDHPAYVAAFRASLKTLAALPCDLLITPHPSASNLYDRLAGKAPLADPHACAAYAAAARSRLDARLAAEAPPQG